MENMQLLKKNLNKLNSRMFIVLGLISESGFTTLVPVQQAAVSSPTGTAQRSFCLPLKVWIFLKPSIRLQSFLQRDGIN